MPGVVSRGAATGSQAGDFLRSGLPGTGSWTPTIVNPAKATSTPNVLLWWGHILLHVVSLILSCFNGFGVTLLQKGDSTCAAGDHACFPNAPNTGFVAMAISGSVTHILGVVMILVGAAIWYANDYKKMVLYHSLMMFFLNFSFICSMLVWAMAAYRYHSAAFWLATPGVILELWALMMIFSTSAAIGSKNIVRTFIFTMAVAMDLFIALLYQVGTWDNFGSHIHSTAKSMMWVCFGCQFGAQVVLLLGRIITGNTLNVKTMSTYPFFRSIVLLLLGTSALASSYRFMWADFLYINLYTAFTLPATILSWWTFVYAILPNDANVYPPKPMKGEDDEDDTEEMDEEEDEEEAVEAKYRRGINMNRVQVRK